MMKLWGTNHKMLKNALESVYLSCEILNRRLF